MKVWQQDRALFMQNPLFGNQEMDVRDKVAMKKALYMKEGMHIVTTANKAEKGIDKHVEDIRDRVRRLQADSDEANVQLQEINQRMAQVKDEFQIEDDSQEEKDLALLKKNYDITNHGSTQLLTDEEKKQLAEMGEMTEYQKLSMELYAQADFWKTKISDNQDLMAGMGRAVRNIQTDRLRSHALIDAQKAKDEIMEAASKEAIGILKDDAMDKMEEKAEEIEEAAENQKEKEEEKEERIEAAKEDRAEAEAAVEETREHITEMTENMLEGEKLVQEVDEDIKKILSEQKLLVEDLKGLTINAEA